MFLDQESDLCPGCWSSPFPTVWTMDYIGCVYCELRISHATVARPELFLAPATVPALVSAQTPAATLDRPQSPSTCSFQNCSRKGKSPQTRGRRSAKTLSPTVQEFRCRPSTGSGNISLSCRHDSCSPPLDVGFLSRRFAENTLWEEARKDAVASFGYENCGCTSSYLVSRRSSLYTNQR